MRSPLPPQARDQRLDALRGLALFGVLTMNLPVFARTPLGSGWVESMLPGAANLGPALFGWLGQGKFVAILAGLYGYGIARRRARLGDTFGSIERRRLLFLAALGVAHGLLWPGDVLVAWAITGGVLLLTERVPAPLVVLVGLTLPTALTACGYTDLVEPARRALVASHTKLGWAPLAVAWRYLPLSVPPMLAQATLGLHLARRGVPTWAGFAAGVGGLVLAAVPVLPLLTTFHTPAWTSALCSDLGATGVAAGLATLFLAFPVRALSSVGAAPLSNYLLQTLIFVTFVPPRLHAGGTLALAAATFVLLWALTVAWLRRHPRGPVEALWRRVAYGASDAL